MHQQAHCPFVEALLAAPTAVPVHAAKYVETAVMVEAHYSQAWAQALLAASRPSNQRNAAHVQGQDGCLPVIVAGILAVRASMAVGGLAN